MPAPNFTALFDFEGQFERATQAILETSGILAYITEQPEKMPIIRTGIGFDVGPAIDRSWAQLAKPPGWPDGAAEPQEYFRYNGTLELNVRVARDDHEAQVEGVATLLAELRGKIRTALMRVTAPFTASNLPYYAVTDIRPNGSTSGWSQQQNADILILRFAILWEIRPDAWPAWG